MSDTLANLIDRVQIMLGDSTGTYFTDATVTAAIRQAHTEWNLRAPIFQQDTLVGVADQYEYDISGDFDEDACEIVDVLVRRTTGENNDEAKSVEFDSYILGNSDLPYVRLREPITTSDTLIVRYTKYNTINGLDGSATSTLPARYDQAIVNGGAFFSIMIRAVSRIETVNLSQEQSDNYREMAAAFGSMFAQQMTYAARVRRAPTSDPEKNSWGDNYENWEQ